MVTRRCETCAGLNDIGKHKFIVLYNFFFKYFPLIQFEGHEVANVTFADFHKMFDNVRTFQLCKHFIKTGKSGIRPLRTGKYSERSLVTRLYHFLEYHCHISNMVIRNSDYVTTIGDINEEHIVDVNISGRLVSEDFLDSEIDIPVTLSQYSVHIHSIPLISPQLASSSVGENLEKEHVPFLGFDQQAVTSSVAISTALVNIVDVVIENVAVIERTAKRKRKTSFEKLMEMNVYSKTELGSKFKRLRGV